MFRPRSAALVLAMVAAACSSSVTTSGSATTGTAAPATSAPAAPAAAAPTSAPAAPVTTSVATTTAPPTTAPVPSSTAAHATTATTATTAVTTSTAPAGPCTPSAGYTAGTTEHHLTVDGVDRTLLVHLPPVAQAGMRLVVDFHGASSDMIQQEIYSGFDPLADREGFVTASPNGVDAAVRQWRFLGKEDADFGAAIVAELAAHACVDAAHAYAVGISSGAAMSASLACQESAVFAGFGLVSADLYVPALCDGAARRPVVIFHGTADPVVPYDGGSVNARGNAGVVAAPAEETAAAWAAHDGCSAGSHPTTLGTEVTRLDWTGCAVPVVMYRIEGGGHTWPGSAIAVPYLGMTTRQIDATQTMWDFFTATT